jgi:hypothetical protein
MGLRAPGQEPSVLAFLLFFGPFAFALLAYSRPHFRAPGFLSCSWFPFALPVSFRAPGFLSRSWVYLYTLTPHTHPPPPTHTPIAHTSLGFPVLGTAKTRKARISAFFFRARRFPFFALFFHCAFALFYGFALTSAKKAPAPTPDNKQLNCIILCQELWLTLCDMAPEIRYRNLPYFRHSLNFS